MKIAILINPSTRLKMTGFSMLLPSKEPNPLVPSTGATRKSPKPSTSAKARVPAISFLESLAAILEALYPTAGVHYALLAGIERVALGAEVHRDRVPRCRARLELVAAHAAHQRLRIFWVYASFHPVPPYLKYR